MEQTPIRELMINTLHPRYFLGVEAYLKEHGCTITYFYDFSYLVKFPPGTVEEGGFIKLPDGTQIQKRVQVSLLFPKEVYGGG